MITKDYDHTTIKAWVEKHSGVPALVAETTNEKDDGFLRIHFPNHNDSKSALKETDGNTFFESFDANKPDLLYQVEKSDGEESTFYKFINRE